jgi:chloramphenicol-sensitive protein RarD
VTEQRRTKAAGLWFAFGAYGLWGLFPSFFTALDPAGPLEVMAHRVVWTFAFMAIVQAIIGRLRDVAAIDRHGLLLLACSSALISANWLIYVYAVDTGRVVDTAFGYYVNPLISVLLGVVVFGERLNYAQRVALVVAVVAVVLLGLDVHGPPFIALGLAISFALYGAVKKVVQVDPRVGVGVEAALAAPFAAAYLGWLQQSGQAAFTNHGPGHTALMLLCGPVTAVPLLMFAAAAQRLPLITIGLVQYLTPSMLLAWGVIIGREGMSVARWSGFTLIWVALLVLSTDAIARTHRKGHAGS